MPSESVARLLPDFWHTCTALFGLNLEVFSDPFATIKRVERRFYMPSDSSLPTKRDKVACHIGKGTNVSPKEKFEDRNSRFVIVEG